MLVDAARLRDSDEALGPAAAPALLGVLLGLLGGALAFRSRRFLRMPRFAQRRLWSLAALVASWSRSRCCSRSWGYVVSSAGLFVGLILAPLAEQQLRRALALSEGDWGTLVSSPPTVTLWILVLLALVAPPCSHL